MEASQPHIPQPGPVDRPDAPQEERPELEPDVTAVDDSQDFPADLLSDIRQARVDAQPFGKTKILEVPGYRGLLAIEYQYIGSEITEAIARKVRRETRAANGAGSSLLGSIDTLRAACKRVLVRRNTTDKWISIGGAERPYVRLDSQLAGLLNYEADDGREVVLGLFGSEHKIVQQNVILSQWLADQTRQLDEDFLS